MFTLVLAPLFLLSLVIFVNVHELKIHIRVILATLSLPILQSNHFTLSSLISTTNHILCAHLLGPIWLQLLIILSTTRSRSTFLETFGSIIWNCACTKTLTSWRPNQWRQPHDYQLCTRPMSPLPRLLPQLLLALPMSRPHHDLENPTEQTHATPPSSYESAWHLLPDTISFTLACLKSNDRLLILLICLCILRLLFLSCFSFCIVFFSFLDYESVCFKVGTIVVPLTFCWIPPCHPSPILVTEIRCRTDGSDLKLSLASNNHLHVDLVFVPPYTPPWDFLYSCLTDHQYITPFTGFYEAHELNEILDDMSMCRVSIWYFVLFLFFMDPDTHAPFPASQQASSMFSGDTVLPNFSCLFPITFDGTTDFEDFVTQFDYVASLCDWRTTHQVICVLSFFLPVSVATLWVFIVPWFEPSTVMWTYFFTLFELSMPLIKMHIGLKLKLCANNQDKLSPLISGDKRFSPHCFSCRGCPQWNTLDHFCCRLVPPHCSVGGSQSESRRCWRCTASIRGNSFIPWNWRFESQTSGFNNISTDTPLDTFTELVRSRRTEIQEAVDQPSRTDQNASQNNQRYRSDSRNKSRYWSPLPGPRRKNNFSDFKKPNQPNEQNNTRNSNNQRNSSLVRFSDKSNNNKGDRVSSSQRSDEQKRKTLWPKQPFLPWVQSMFQMWQKWQFQARMPCTPPKLKLKAPAYQRGNGAGNSKSLKLTKCLNSVLDEKSVIVRVVTACEVPLDVVRHTRKCFLFVL